MDARVGAGDEIRPGDGALRRDAGAEGFEAAGVAQLSEVGELALGHEPLAEARVHAVHADDDELAATGVALAAAVGPERIPTGTGGEEKQNEEKLSHGSCRHSGPRSGGDNLPDGHH